MLKPGGTLEYLLQVVNNQAPQIIDTMVTNDSKGNRFPPGVLSDDVLIEAYFVISLATVGAAASQVLVEKQPTFAGGLLTALKIRVQNPAPVGINDYAGSLYVRINNFGNLAV